MKVSTLVTTALLAASQVANAVPTANYEDVSIENRDVDEGYLLLGAGYHQEQHLRKRNTDNQRITGVRVGYSGAYRVYRQEIRKFRNDQSGRVHDLFLLALQRMYDSNHNGRAQDLAGPNSYWQLAGIHGRPFQRWGPDDAPSTSASGYCTHGSTLFPTWHRPYLAYLEEVIWKNCEWIINNQIPWQQRDAWRQSLMVMRLPYFDFAADSNFPDVFRAPIWTFRFHPRGAGFRDHNPLYAGQLMGKPYDSQFGGQFATWSRTRRFPTNENTNENSGERSWGSNNLEVHNGLRAAGANLKQQTLELLLDNARWDTFSNRASGFNGGNYVSLESIHDTVHGLLGRNGHMSYVEYSAFDPVFFILHCNVDRLFAIWQAIRPTTYVSSQVNRGGTYGVAPGTTETRTSRMRPFKGLSGEYWNSDGVRDTSLFGYGYYETPKWKYSKATENQYANEVRRTVQNLYGNSALTTTAMRKRDLSNSTEAAIDASIIGNDKYYEWRINCIADKSEGNGTYFIHFFLGKPSRDPKEWYTQPELVGEYVVFAHTHQVAPGIDPAAVDNTVTGGVALTAAMIKAFPDTNLRSLNPQDAIPFLIKNLRWRATDNAGNPIRLRKLPSLKVSVSISLASLPAPGREWTEYGPWEPLTEITRRIGRDGGPDKVNVIPDLSSSVPASASTTAAPVTSSEPAIVEEATTTSEAVEPTSTESAASAETTA